MLGYLAFKADLSTPEAVAAYDELPLWSALFGALLLREVPLRPDSVALDVGCGTGFPLLELAERLGPASRVYGIDPWEAALERARLKAQAWGVANVEIVQGDAAAMPTISIVKKWRREFEDHLRGRCAYKSAGALVGTR